MPAPQTNAKQWDEIRAAFATSIMINTALSSLAQNLDGPDWPVKGKDETPATYIDYSFEEVIDLLALKGQAPESLDLLVTILKETLAFDNPFGEMVEQVAVSTEKDNQFLKNLARLGVPEDFPIQFVRVGKDTQDFCKLEQINTIGAFAVFAQSMSQNVIVGGDFRELLNALAHIDEKALQTFLPLRTGQKGVFLFEAIWGTFRTLPPEVQSVLAKKYGVKGAPNQPKFDSAELEKEEAALAASVDALISWFQVQLDELNRELAVGQPLDRFLMILGNPDAELVVAGLLRPHLPALKPASAKKKRGFWSRLFGL